MAHSYSHHFTSTTNNNNKDEQASIIKREKREVPEEPVAHDFGSAYAAHPRDRRATGRNQPIFDYQLQMLEQRVTSLEGQRPAKVRHICDHNGCHLYQHAHILEIRIKIILAFTA